MKVYYLGTCSTCQRIMSALPLEGFVKHDIRKHPITPQQLDTLKELAGSYEALFSRRAMQYRTLKLNQSTLNEQDYRRLILDEYTFLKRPVFIVKDRIYIGSSKKVIASLAAVLGT